MNIHIETKRFLLRDLELSDAAGMFDLDSDPEVHQYLGNKPIKTTEEAEDIIRNVKSQYIEFGIGRWAVIDKQTNDFVGWSGLKYEQHLREDFKYFDIGYRLRRKYWGKGIATETAIAAIKYGFTNLHLKEIFAAANIDNTASNVVLGKVGLKLVDTFQFMGATHNWYTLDQKNWLDLNQ